MTLFETQIQEVRLLPREMKVCIEQAERAEVGGRSNIRNGDERAAQLKMDQIIGQLGEYALSMYLTGSPIEYLRQRTIANMYPDIGDSGQDIFGLNLDVKTSIMRRPDKPALQYTLAVRPREMHKDWCYVLALVMPNGHSGLSRAIPVRVFLVGWLNGNELPETPDEHGTFSGAHTVAAIHLHPLPNLNWLWSD